MDAWWWLVTLICVIILAIIQLSTYFRRCSCGKFRLGFNHLINEYNSDTRVESTHTEDYCSSEE